MSSSQYADDMERQAPISGSIRRARERAAAGAPREDFATFATRMGQPTQSQQQQQQQQQPQREMQQLPMQMPTRPQLTGLAGQAGQNITTSRIPIPRPTGGALQMKGGQIGVAISNPTPAAQWPLAGPIEVPSNAEPYRPPPGRSQPPQRPPRPSNVPSILDGSRIQDPTPSVFPYNSIAVSSDSPTSLTAGDKASGHSDLSGRQSFASTASRPSTISSVGSIPDFPVPVTVPALMPAPLAPPPVPSLPLPRRSVTLGPPPSARRGASSFYSTASFVSPIPEESPRSRSHTSFASSAAMPESWGTVSSPSMSPNYTADSTYYEDIIPEDGQESTIIGAGYDEDDDHGSGASTPNSDDGRRLVRSASLGKRAKASIVTTGAASRMSDNSLSAAAAAAAAATGPSREGTSYFDTSSSSSAITAPPSIALARATLTPDNILEAYEAASDISLANPSRRMSVSPRPPSSNPNYSNDYPGEPARQYSRLSAIRRPPRLDLDAVRKAEARGSLTSLPDLIRRATRLAASLERGHRPASRMNDFSMSPGMMRDDDKEMAIGRDRHQSGLSDMLAAFPPPAHASRPSMRRSFRDQVGSWPIPLIGGGRGSPSPFHGDSGHMKEQRQRKGRRCCGLPLWGFLLILFVVLVVVAAAIVIPLEFFVIRKKSTGTTLEKCEKQLTCLNGGTNFVSDEGFCSCICTNGFSGIDCSNSDEDGCTTTTLTTSTSTSTNSSGLTNVTIGDGLPRLIEQAQANFSISLSGTQILAMLNAGNLSCTAQNALVTFDGETVRQSDGSTEVSNLAVNNDAIVANGVEVMTVTIMPGADTTITISPSTETVALSAGAGDTLVTDDGSATLLKATATTSSKTTSALFLPTSTTTTTVTVTPTKTTASSSTSASTGTSAGGKTSTGASSSSGSSTATTSSLASTATFTVTEDVLDFARVAVLYILQEESLANAETAQTALQKFFSSASDGADSQGTGVTVEDARNLTLSNGNSINLETFEVMVVSGLSGSAKRKRGAGGWSR